VAIDAGASYVDFALSEAIEQLAKRHGNEPRRDQTDEIDALDGEIADLDRAVAEAIHRELRDHPAVQEWASAARVSACAKAFRRFRNIDIGELKIWNDGKTPRVSIVDSWLLEHAPPLLEDPCNTLEDVRRELAKRANAIRATNADGTLDPDDRHLNALRSMLLRPLRTRAAFHKRISKLFPKIKIAPSSST
jgi:hypothetical protein